MGTKKKFYQEGIIQKLDRYLKITRERKKIGIFN